MVRILANRTTSLNVSLPRDLHSANREAERNGRTCPISIKEPNNPQDKPAGFERNDAELMTFGGESNFFYFFVDGFRRPLWLCQQGSCATSK
jgi:hypothetical protein